MSKKERDWTWEEDGMKVVRSIARTGPGCHEGCGVLLYVKNGNLVKVVGDPEFPQNQGRLCPRCLALTQVVYLTVKTIIKKIKIPNQTFIVIALSRANKYKIYARL